MALATAPGREAEEAVLLLVFYNAYTGSQHVRIRVPGHCRELS
jgi:hypothetical protein